MAIEIEILTDTQKAGRDLADLAGDFEGVEQAAEDAERGIEDLERKTREAGDSGKELDSSLTSALENVESEAKAAGDAIGTELSGGLDEAGTAAGDFGVSAEDAAGRAKGGLDGVKDAAGNLADEAVPGLGAAFSMGIGGLAVGAITLLVEWLKRSAEESEEARKKAVDMAQSIVDAGGDIEQLDVAGAIREWGYEAADVKSWFEPWQQRTITNFEKWNEKLAEGSVAWADFAEAMSGANPEKTNEALAETERLLAAEEERREEILRILQTSADLTDAERDALREEWAARVDNIQALTDQRNELQKVADQQALTIEYAGLEASATENVTEALEDKREALEDAVDAYRDNIDAQIAYYEQTEKTNEVLKENGANTDLSTEAGRENVEAILDQADANVELLESMAANGASAEDIRAKWAQLRQELFDQAVQAGYTREEAQELIDTYLGTPTQVDTRFTSNADRAEREASDYNDEVNSTPSEVNTDVNFNASSVDAQSAVNNAMSRVVRPIVKVRFEAANTITGGWGRV